MVNDKSNNLTNLMAICTVGHRFRWWNIDHCSTQTHQCLSLKSVKHFEENRPYNEGLSITAVSKCDVMWCDVMLVIIINIEFANHDGDLLAFHFRSVDPTLLCGWPNTTTSYILSLLIHSFDEFSDSILESSVKYQFNNNLIMTQTHEMISIWWGWLEWNQRYINDIESSSKLIS